MEDIKIKDSTKNKLILLVKKYKNLFVWEYNALIEQNKIKKKNMINETGNMSKISQTINRPLMEISETLDNMIKTELNEEQYKEYLSINGSRWFANKFKEFSIVEKI